MCLRFVGDSHKFVVLEAAGDREGERSLPQRRWEVGCEISLLPSLPGGVWESGVRDRGTTYPGCSFCIKWWLLVKADGEIL